MQIRLFLAFVILLLPSTTLAHPVINEVMWAGSDLSTADEWIEILNPDDSPVDVSGWVVTTLNSKGEHVIGARFATGTILEPGQFFIVARKSASASRLLLEPDLIAPDLVLPNTALLLRFMDAERVVIDSVDDGSGAPFAGANPSGSGSKASMERIDPATSDNLKDNWQTASASVGFDDGAHMLGTPGQENLVPKTAPPSECVDPLSVRIGVQSGVPDGDQKVTINLQAEAETGTLPTSGCRFDFADGTSSTSCNPASHTFDQPGSYPVLLQVRNRCGIVLQDTLTVIVRGEPSAPADSSARLMLHAALPNPKGADTGKEWIEIRNPEARTVSLVGWKIRIGITSFRWVILKGSVGPESILRIYDSELKLGLTNAKTEVVLVAPDDTERSLIRWPKAPDEDREYFPADLERITIRGTVIRAMSSEILDVALDSDVAFITGSDRAFIRLLGIRVIPNPTGQTSSNPSGFIEDLAKGSRVEIETDEDLYDEDGILQGYVYPDARYCLQNQLLMSGGWMVDRAIDFRKKDEFLAIEKPSVLIALETNASSDVASKSGAVVSDSHEIHYDYSGLQIEEIYASPPAKSVQTAGILLSEEWLEIGLGDHDVRILSGVILHVGSKKKPMQLSAVSVSGSIALVGVSDLKVGLPNAGAVVELLSPDGTQISSVSYPKLKNGSSYAHTDDGVWCITSVVTPLSHNQCSELKAGAKSSLRTQTVSRKSPLPSARIRSYAGSYAESLERRLADPTVIISSHDDSSVIVKVLVAFFTGVLLTGILGFFLYRKGFLRNHRMPIVE